MLKGKMGSEIEKIILSIVHDLSFVGEGKLLTAKNGSM
jgi:hypothetical protein